MKTTATRRLEWDSAHRVLRHESKCATIHGHRYAAEIECTADKLDGVGRVVDFGVVKERVGAWIDTYWDHTALVNSRDDVLLEVTKRDHRMNGKRAPYVFVDAEPTAENIAARLLEVASGLLEQTGVRVTRVRVYETPNCYAEVLA